MSNFDPDQMREEYRRQKEQENQKGKGRSTQPQSTVDIFLLEQSADDVGNARCVSKLYSNEYLFCDAYGWLHWNGTHWRRAGARENLNVAIIRTLERRRLAAVRADREKIVRNTRGTASNVKNCQYILESFLTTDVSQFDKSPDMINCLNGAVDLRTGAIYPHLPTQNFTYVLPVEYHPNADQMMWKEFLHQATDRNDELDEYIRLTVGYSLTGYTREECLFYLYGPTRSGKGTFTETLLHMMGREPLAVEADFTTFTRRRDQDAQNFDLAELKPCRIVFASESNKYQTLNPARIKAMTGGNDVRCAFKHRDHFSYRPQFKIWLSSNEHVNADVDDEATWYRVKVITFPNSFAGREDKTLKGRLRQPATLQGVLAWCIEGAKAWYSTNARGLPTPTTVAAATQRARDEADYVQQWLEECVRKTNNSTDRIPNSVLYHSYKEWCIENGVKPKQIRGLTRALKRKGYEAGKPFTDAMGKSRRGCWYIEIK